MWRVFKRYSIGNVASYGGTDCGAHCDASDLNLDEVSPTIVGGIRIAALLEISLKRRLTFAHALRALTDLAFFKTLMSEQPPLLDEHTNKKWKKHLRQLQSFGILKRTAKSAIKCFARYFAVPKGSTSKARAIFNGKKMSSFFVTPPTTNLPEVAEVLHMLARSSFLVIGDFRHFFHQFGLDELVSNHFGLQQGDDIWRYTVLPMGWSWSPRLAQAASTSLLIEAAIRGKLAKKEDFEDLVNPPSVVKMRGGSAVVWYDNVLGAFENADCRDIFYNELTKLCTEVNVQWKDIAKHNRNDMPESLAEKAEPEMPLSPTDPAKNQPDENTKMKKLPEYLGLELANATGKRQHDGSHGGKLKWRHRLSSTAKWKDLSDIATYQTPRAVARAVGVILWDATISLRPLCEEAKALEFLSKVGKTIRNNKWDEPLKNCLLPEEIVYLRDRLHDIINNNVFRSIDPRMPDETILCASDASDNGYGFVIWQNDIVDKATSALTQISFPSNLSKSHIYIKEMYAAMQCIEKVANAHPNSIVRLAEDNTAVVWALRNGYSHNKISNEYILRIVACLRNKNCKLQIVPIPSKCNAADAPSRGWPYNNVADADCRRILHAFADGRGNVEQSAAMPPAFTGSIRHDEPDDLWLGWQEAPEMDEEPFEIPHA